MNKLQTVFIFAVACLLLSGVSFAEDENEKTTRSEPVKTKKLYRVVDKNGKVSFSDQPSAGAKEVVMQEVISIKMDKPKVDIESLVEENQIKRDPNAEYYSFMGFQNLQNDGVVRNNGGTVPLTAKLEPSLSKSHYLKFYIDNKQIGDLHKELTITADNIEYGPHIAHFVVVSSTGAMVQQSAKVSFNLLHVVRKRVSNVNNLTNDIHKIALPQHPKVPSYESKKKTDN